MIIGLLRENIEDGIALGNAMAALTLGWDGDQFQGDPDIVERLLRDEPIEIRR